MGISPRQPSDAGLSTEPVRTSKKRAATLAGFVALFVAAFLAFVSSLLMRGEALTTGFYMGALDRSRAFDRVYEDLLADPEFARSMEPFFGRLGVDRSYAVSALRYVAPPGQIRQWTQSALGQATAYVRGDTAEYSGEVDFSQLIRNQETALTTYVQQQMLSSGTRTVLSTDELEEELRAFTGELSRGNVPLTIPVGSYMPQDAWRISDAILSRLSPEEAAAVRVQVEAYVTSHDIIGALATVVPVLLRPHIADANAQIAEFLGEDATVDVAATFANILHNRGDRVVDRLDHFRSNADTYSPKWLPWAAIGVMTLSMGGVLWMTRGGITSRLMAAGLLLFFAGSAVWITAQLAGPQIVDAVSDRPLAPALADRPEGWGLPQSARTLVADIRGEMYQGLVGRASSAAIFMLYPGAAMIVLAIVSQKVPEITHGKHRWLLEKEVAPALAITAIAVATVPLLLISLPERRAGIVCNGSAELCDRKYDEVVFPATHNSMSNASEGWLLPSSDVGIRQQLEDGVRAFLIDTHYWSDSQDAVQRISMASGVPPAELAAISSLLSRFGSPPPGPFLCHSSCWLGATPFVSALRDVRIFLGQEPGAVVTLIIQDGISEEDTERAFRDAGLLPFLYTPEPGEPWPTLGKMVESGQRLVVMAEVGGAPSNWYIHAWDVMQETPFNFPTQASLSCAPNRGDSENPLFLMNHWINRAAPDRVDASMLNRFDTIVDRAHECEEERGKLPNFVAVNFHRLGDLFRAVDHLNGLD